MQNLNLKKYHSFLIKCAIINASVFMVGSAMAEDTISVDSWEMFSSAINNNSISTINVVDDNITFGSNNQPLTQISRNLLISGDVKDRYLSGDGKYKGLAVGLTGKKGELILKQISMQNFYSTSQGGAIQVLSTGTVKDITGNFDSNSVTSYGGAIANSGVITNIAGNFTSNNADFAGGAIYNKGIIENVTGNFTQNSTNRYGGALANINGEINFVTTKDDKKYYI